MYTGHHPHITTAWENSAYTIKVTFKDSHVNDKMKSIILLLLCFWIEGTLTEYQHYYVKSETSDTCPLDLPCEALDVYVSNESAYFTDNTCFIFLPGTHTLNSTVSIHNVTNVALVGNADLNEGNVTIQCNGSGGLVFQHASHVKLVNLSFASCGQPLPDSLQRDGETAQAALAFGEVSDLLLDSVSVSHSTGYGVLGHCVHGNFEIVYCLFDSNKGNTQHLGGNAAIEYTNCTMGGAEVYIFSSTFTNGDYDGYSNHTNTYGLTFATGINFILSHTDIVVLIEDTVMESNKNNMQKGIGGNLFVHFYNNTDFTSNRATIVNSTIKNGASWGGGGIAVTLYILNKSAKLQPQQCTNVFELHNVEITNNTATVGGGLYYEILTDRSSNECTYINMSIYNSTFCDNSIKVLSNYKYKYSLFGVAVHMFVKTVNNKFIEQPSNYFYNTLFENCTFINSKLLTMNNMFAKIALAGVTLLIDNFKIDTTTLKNCEVIDNEFSGIGLSNSKVHMIGNNWIRNNTGIFGGGLQLCESSYIILRKYSSITFINNHAVQSGGGVYLDRSCRYTKPFCFYQLYHTHKCLHDESVSITMIGNTAGYAGDHIYGGELSSCKINMCNSSSMFQDIFTIIPNNSESAVTSNPTGMCFCFEGKPNCSNKMINISEAMYPGEIINVSVATVGQFDGTVPGTILYQTETDNSGLKPEPIVTTGKKCTEVEIKIKSSHSKANYSVIKMSLESDFESSPGSITYLTFSPPHKVVVLLKRCPPGFNFSKHTCDCDSKLQNNHVICDISDHTITRTPPAWIGYNNNNTDNTTSEGIIYHSVCPYDYCINDEVNVISDTNTFDQDSQCAPNRTGILCSQCKDGFTLSMGTSDCIQCNTKLALPLSIAGFLVIGIALVFILILLDITHTNGTLSGLQFYANIVNLNCFIFFRLHSRNILTHIISWMNLSIGFKSCIYDGMDSYVKSWVGFFFPIYLFIVVAVIIVLCRNSNRLSSLFGSNITKILATLLLLSYTKLLQSVVTVLSSTVIEYPSNTTSSGRVRKLVWLSDPSQEYFSGKHIPLALVAIVFGLLILAYTLVLLFVQPLQRYSHLCCFSWMAKLKPLIDAYTAPNIIKDNCRYWEGLLLLFRSFLAVAFAGNVESKIDTNLIAISLSCILLLSIAWSAGGVYKKTHLNILNMLSIANLAVLSMAMSYINKNETNAYQLKDLQRHRKFLIVSYTSFTAASLIAIAIMAKQVYAKMKLCHQKCKRKEYQALDTSDNMPSLRQFPIQPSRTT